MSGIQVLLFISVGASFILYLVYFRTILWDRLIGLTLVCLAFVCISAPNLTTAVANILGVGRGADLLIYLSIATGVFVNILLYSRLQRLERTQTELVRHLALLNAREPQEDVDSSGAE